MAHSRPSFTSTPSIQISSSPNNHQSRNSRSPPSLFHASLPDRARTAPMSIRNSSTDSPPPPLPPPRHIEGINEGHDPGWHFANQEESRNTAPIKAGSSLLGGQPLSSPKSYTGPERAIDLGRPSSRSGDSQGDSSPGYFIPDIQALLEYNRLRSEKQLGQRALETSSHAYDKHLLSRIGGPHTPPRSGAGPTGAGAEEALTSETTLKKLNGQLRPLSMPERRHSDYESIHTSRWTGAPSSSASPGFSSLRSPLSDKAMERPSHHRASTFNNSDDPPHVPGRLARTSSYDQQMFDDQDYISDRSRMHETNSNGRSPSGTDDQNSRAGQKRRAQSPPGEPLVDPRLATGNNSNDPWARPMQLSGGRNPQAPKYQPNPGSLSSSASSVPRDGSYASSYGMSASTATSYSSERLSPGDYSTPDASSNSPRNTLPSLPPTSHPPHYAPPGSIPPVPHRRTTSSGILRAPNLWICDCCPKKPKKFESEEELRVHEMEKQYICQYCHNRFKNKNEAERHQNSLHLRRHSWSCAALTSFEMAFHPTPTNTIAASLHAHSSFNSPNYPHHNQHPHQAPSDTCGYCGAEFVNPPDWNARVEHLNHVHKFGECNQSKKFYRADHFRQHLKHSHAGTSGKWTNMLENACMKDEPPPQPLPPGIPGIGMISAMAGAGGSGGAPVATMLPGMHPGQPQSHPQGGYGQPGQLSDVREE